MYGVLDVIMFKIHETFYENLMILDKKEIYTFNIQRAPSLLNCQEVSSLLSVGNSTGSLHGPCCYH